MKHTQLLSTVMTLALVFTLGVPALYAQEDAGGVDGRPLRGQDVPQRSGTPFNPRPDADTLPLGRFPGARATTVPPLSDPTVSDRLEMRDERRAEFEERREERMEARDAFRAELRTRVSDRFTNAFERITQRLEAAGIRLEDIANRILSRIDTIEEMHNVDLSDARDAAEEALDTLGGLDAILTALQNTLDEALDADTPRDFIDAIRAHIADAKTLFGDVRALLTEAVQNIRAANPDRPDISDDDDTNDSDNDTDDSDDTDTATSTDDTDDSDQ